MPLLTTNDVVNELQDDPDYLRFVRASDRHTAWDLVDRARRWGAGRFGQRIRKIRATTFNKQAIRDENDQILNDVVDLMKDFMRVETPKLTKNKENIRRLAAQADRGELSEALLDPRNMEKPWLAQSRVFCLNAEAEDLTEGFEWVMRRSHTFRLPHNTTHEERHRQKKVIQDTLYTAMLSVVRNNTDVTSVATLDYLHQHAGTIGADYRLPTVGLADKFYGGVAIGRYLQREVAQAARGLRVSAIADRFRWYDIACLQLLGNIIAHGFGDGNGRSSRALFACTQVQKGLPFVAPSFGWTVHKTDHPQSNQPAFDTLDDAIRGQLGWLPPD
jgi:hypothetical protein